jgi:O-antigen ligase
VLLNLKALIVVFSVAISVFIVAKPACLRFMTPEDFIRRRNVWLALTVAAFSMPSFWIFLFVAVPILVWARVKETNTLALYVLLMHVIPPSISIPLPRIGSANLFSLDWYRILAFALLVPRAWTLFTDKKIAASTEARATDSLLIAYCALQVVLLMPYESFTHTMRRTFLLSIDVLVIYAVASRSCSSRRAIAEVFACFSLVACIQAVLAAFESLRSWLLYQNIGEYWGNPDIFAWLERNESVRAMASGGHSIALGYLLAVAFAFSLYLGSHLRSTKFTIFIAALLWSGMIATYARAPWIVGLWILYVFAGVGPRPFPRLIALSLVTIAIGIVLVLSPIGATVVDRLPFVGSVGAETVTYRQHLAERSWELIMLNPLFGSPFVLLYLEELRQGQGIIDLMNTYATVALFYGVVGLTLFVGFFLVPLWKTYKATRACTVSHQDFALLGASLVACMSGTLVMAATGSFGTILERMFWILAGLGTCYASVATSTPSAMESDPPRRGHPY